MGYRDKLIFWVSKVSDRDLLEIIQYDGSVVLIDEYVVGCSWVLPVVSGSGERSCWHRQKKSPLQNRGLSG